MPSQTDGLIIIPPGTLTVGDRDESTKILEIVRRNVALTFPAVGPLGIASASAAIPDFTNTKPGVWECFVDWNDVYADGEWTKLVAASAGNGIVTVTAMNVHSGVTASAITAKNAFMLAFRR